MFTTDPETIADLKKMSNDQIRRQMGIGPRPMSARLHLGTDNDYALEPVNPLHEDFICTGGY